MRIAFTEKKESEEVAKEMLSHIKTNIPKFLKITNTSTLPECIRREISTARRLMNANDYTGAVQELKASYLLIRAVVQ